MRLRFAGLQQVGAPVGHQLSANPLVVIPVQLEPAILPSYTILPLFVTPNQALACRRARLRRRSFLRRHFHRWFPVFFQAREPRFMVNRSPTDHSYMSASGYTAHNFFNYLPLICPNLHSIYLIGSGRIRIRTRVFGLEGQSDIQATLYALIHRR